VGVGFRVRPVGAALLLAFQLSSSRRAWRHYRSLPEPPREHASDAGMVSIVVPARNEAGRIPALLDSLGHLRYPEREVVVVDDGSSDGTGEIAARAGARVIRVPGPRTGWTGKSFACFTGAEATSGDWLLFTDADTVHRPESLGRALALASDRHAGLVSLLARQHCRTFWERLLLPYAYALYFAGADPAASGGVANGQYLLFRRDDYERIGGHKAVRSSLIEDVALARRCRRLGVHVVLARGERDLDVHMYDDLRSLWEGFGKNAFRFVAALDGTGGFWTVSAAVTYGMALPAAFRSRSVPMRMALAVAPTFGLLRWERLFGVSAGFAFLYPLAAATFQLIALDSIRRSLLPGGTVWKGRRY
jgi:chlorobactene glucosyltransferase